jgi:DNA-binding response OmpR family regulator
MANDTSKARILVVEDDEFLRSLAAKRLDKEGFLVSVAVDGDSALAGVKENRPDLVLLDLILPGINGFEVLQQLQRDESLKTIPVIVFSNLGQPEDIERAKNYGAVDYFIKSNLTLDDLMVKIKSHLGPRFSAAA